MKYKNINKYIWACCITAFTLLLIAVITVNNTFSVDVANETSKKWDVYFSEPMKLKGEGNVIVSNDKLDVGVNLSSGEEYRILTSINNDGDFDAKLNNFKVTNLPKIKVGSSAKTGNIYYMSDYIVVKSCYTSNNEVNKIREEAPMSNNDLLKFGTKNEVYVSVKMRDDLTEDQKYVLSEYYPSGKLNLNITINAVYQQA